MPEWQQQEGSMEAHNAWVVGRGMLLISGHGEGASGRLTVSRVGDLMMIQKGAGVYLKISRG